MKKQDARKLLRQYNEIYKQMDDVYHSLARHYGLSDSAFWILYLLRETDKISTQSDLCSELSLSKQTIHSGLKSLEANGYLRLEQEEGNRRNKKIILTEAGERLAEETIDHVLEVDQKAFELFTDEEASIYLTLFQKHLKQLQEEIKTILQSSNKDL